MIYFISNRLDTNGITNPEIVIESTKFAKEEIDKLIESGIVSLDFETSGLETFTLLPILLAIGNKDIQIIIDCITCNVNKLVSKDIENCLVLGQNIKYDWKILKVHYGIHLNNTWDTMLADRKLFQGASFSNTNPKGMLFNLKELHKRHLKFVPESMQDKEEIRNRFIGQTANSYNPINQDILYAASDIQYLEDIMNIQKEKLNRYNLLDAYVNPIGNPLTDPVARMELRGFKFDTTGWTNLIKKNENKQFEVACELDNLLLQYRDELLSKEDKLMLTGAEYERRRNKVEKSEKLGLFGEEICDRDYYGKASPKNNTGNVDWNSPTQVVDICARLKIPLPVSGREDIYVVPKFTKVKDAKGHLNLKLDTSSYTYTTNKEELHLMINTVKNLPAKNLYEKLIEYRKYSHYITGFGKNFLDKINPVTNSIHTIFRTESSETGRFQSGGGRKQPELYNAQNIPRDEDFRHCFIARDGYSITTCDLSGAEVTILCDKAHDATLYEWAVKNDDAHSPIATACWRNIYLYRAGEYLNLWKDSKSFFQKKNDAHILNLLANHINLVVQDNWNKSQSFIISKIENKNFRQTFKNVTFATFYGARAKQIARTLNVNENEGQVIITTMEQTIPNTFKYLNSNVTFVMQNGYLILDDRTNSRVWFPAIIHHLRDGEELTFKDRKDAEGGARNYPIQGTQASMIKEAILEIDKAIKEQNIDAHLLSTVHDELVYEQALSYDGKSDEWFNNDDSVVFTFDNTTTLHNALKTTDSSQLKGAIRDLVYNGAENSLMPTKYLDVSFPEFVKLTMCQVANRYLKHYKMGAEYHVAPYWSK